MFQVTRVLFRKTVPYCPERVTALPKGLIYKAANLVGGLGWKSHCLFEHFHLIYTHHIFQITLRKLFTSYFLWKPRVKVVFLFKVREAGMHQTQLIMMMKLIIKCTVSNSLPWGVSHCPFYFVWLWSMLENTSVSNPAFCLLQCDSLFLCHIWS